MRSVFNYIFIFVFALTFFTSCQRKVSVKEFAEEISKDEDLVKIYKDNVFNASCAYLPTEAMVLNEFRGSMERKIPVTKEQIESSKNRYSNASYFLFKLGLNTKEDILRMGVRDRKEYSLRVNQLTYNFSRSVYMLTPDSDTIRAAITDFQRTYGMSPDVSVLIAFPNRDIDLLKNNSIDLVYSDKYFGISKPIVFTFNPGNFDKKMPEINFNDYE